MTAKPLYQSDRFQGALTGAAHLLGALFLTLANASPAATYYVDCENGRDTNDGRSLLTAWRTIERVNQLTCGPGDSILLKRNCAGHGPGFNASGNGTVAAPVTLADYGDPTLP